MELPAGVRRSKCDSHGMDAATAKQPFKDYRMNPAPFARSLEQPASDSMPCTRHRARAQIQPV